MNHRKELLRGLWVVHASTVLGYSRLCIKIIKGCSNAFSVRNASFESTRS